MGVGGGNSSPRHRSNSCPPKSSLDSLPPFPSLEGGEGAKVKEGEGKKAPVGGERGRGGRRGGGSSRVFGFQRRRGGGEEEELKELWGQFQGGKGGGEGEGGRGGEKGYVFVCAGVGDCKAYVYLHREKRVVDFTAKSR